MKTKIFIYIITAFLCTTFQYAGIIDFYKLGIMRIFVSSEFGKKTNWDSLFFDNIKELVIAEDGKIFVTNHSGHNVLEFDLNGNFVGKFGLKGQGPGDLYYPSSPSILDSKYLVIGEYPTSRRISLFNLKGNFIKVCKTNHAVYRPTALKDKKIAYLTYKYKKNNKTTKVRITSIIIKDVDSGIERKIESMAIMDKGTVLAGNSAIKLGNFVGEVIIKKTKGGNLLIGATNSPDLKIITPDGELVRSFRLEMKSIPVTNDYIRRFKNHTITQFTQDKGYSNRIKKRMAAVLEHVSFDALFEERLPYYRNIIVDSGGNILIFKWNECLSDCKEVFQIYSPHGNYICETIIDKGKFDFKIEANLNNIIFTAKAIFGLFQLKGSEDISLRLVKIDI